MQRAACGAPVLAQEVDPRAYGVQSTGRSEAVGRAAHDRPGA